MNNFLVTLCLALCLLLACFLVGERVSTITRLTVQS